MDLPEPVRQASDLADQIEQGIAQQNGQETVQGEQAAPAPMEPEPQVTEQQEPQEQRPQADEDEFAKVQSRYASLKGKYDAEVPRLHGENTELKNRIKQAIDENKALREALAKQSRERTYLTKQDVETFGEDMVGLVRRGAQEESAKYAQRAAELEAQIKHLTEKVEQQQSAAAGSQKANFIRTLSQEFPDWEKYDKDEKFLDWLGKTDENYGFSRQEALDRAVATGDGVRAGRIFRLYASTLAPKENPLARQVTPEHRSSGAQPTTRPKARAWRESDIARYYENDRRGMYTAEQSAQLEKEINEAVASGNVLPG